MVTVTDPAYRIIHTAAAAALGAVVVFLGSYLHQLWRLSRFRRPLRLASVAAGGLALCVVLFVTSPLDYRASAPAGLRLYVLSARNDSTSTDLFTLGASDSAQTFVRHLPGPQLQMRYHAGGLLILAGPGADVPAATATATTDNAGATGTAGTAAGANTGATGQVYVYTLQAVRGDDGQAVLPALKALAHMTADILDHDTLYVTALADPAHPDAVTLSAFSLQAGALLWQRALLTPAPAPAPIPTSPPPRFCGSDSGALYVLLGTRIAAVRIGDGAMLWRSAPLWPSSSSSSQSATALNCVAQEGGVYLVVRGGSDAGADGLIKLDERDGTQRWHVPVASLITVAGDRLYATRATPGLLLPRLVVLRASDGIQLGAPVEIGLDDLQASLSATSAGVLYVVGRPTSPPNHAFTACEIFAISLRDGARLWQRPPHACNNPQGQALRVAGGTLYYTTNTGDLTALRIADGSVLWTHTGYSRGGEFVHWADTFAIGGFSAGVLFVDANHEVPCRLLVVGCDPDNGQYLEALNPTTGSLYWRYRWDQIAGYLPSFTA